jgi:hypothetical protein
MRVATADLAGIHQQLAQRQSPRAQIRVLFSLRLLPAVRTSQIVPATKVTPATMGRFALPVLLANLRQDEVVGPAQIAPPTQSRLMPATRSRIAPATKVTLAVMAHVQVVTPGHSSR